MKVITFKQKFPRWIVITFAIEIIIFLLVGYWLFYSIEQRYRHQVEDQLSAIAELKVKQITQWRDDRLADINELAESPFFADGLNKLLKSHSAADRSNIIARFNSIAKHHRYKNVMVIDTAGNILTSLSENAGRVDDEDSRVFTAAMREKRPLISSLHFSSVENVPELDAIAPIYLPNGMHGRIVAVVVVTDPSKFLYPLIQSWPVPSRTSETLLIERDDGDVVFLNELRHQAHTALSLRIPLTMREVPAVRAVLGERGIFEGKDYRGINVISALAEIPGSPWFLVSKVDKEEAFEGMWLDVVLVWLFTFGFLVASIAITIVLHQQKTILKSEYDGKIERLALVKHFDYLARYANDIILLTDERLRIIEANDRALQVYQYSHDEIRKLSIRELRTEEAGKALKTDRKHVETSNGYVFETVHRRKDGTTFPVEESTRLIETEGRKYYQSILRDITERKRLETARQHSENSLKEAQRIGRIGNWDLDLDRNVLTWSDEIYRIFEIDPKEFGASYEAFLNGIHPDDREFVNTAYTESVKNKTPYDIVHRLLMKDGRVKYVNERCETFYDLDGRPLRSIGTVHDITERKQAEEALRQSEIKYRTIFENVQDVFYKTDEEGRIIDISPSIHRYAGYTCEELIGKSVGEVYANPEDRNILMNELYQKGEVIDHVVKLQTKNAQLKYVSVNTHLIRDASGKPNGVEGALRDITERKLAEEARQVAENKYRSIFENAIVGIFQSTPSGRFITVNPALATMLGYDSPEELITATTDIAQQLYVHPEKREELKRLVEDQKIVSRFEAEVYKKDGSKMWISENTRAVLDAHGNVLHYEGFIENITEKKTLETQFLRAQRMESLGTLAGGIAHDLNNVLAPIMMAAELLQKYPHDDQSTRMLNVISASASRGADIVKQVLAFSRGAMGERTVIQPKHVLKEIESFIKETLPRNIAVHFEIQKNLLSLSADPTQLHQVVMNLCVNVRDAMPKGGALTVKAENIYLDQKCSRMHPGTKPGPHILITVADTGMGIPQQIIDKIFDPFFTTKPIGKGTGLGLSTTASIVKSHGGFISVESTIGKGSEFKVYLPAVETEQSKEAKKQPLSVPMANNDLVLVVDDEASVREITKAALESNGYRVLAARDGTEAIALFLERKDEFKVVLMDMMMPIMDGATTIRALEKIGSQLTVVATSGLAEHKAEAESLSPAVKGFLQKPYTSEKLLETLHEVLSRS